MNINVWLPVYDDPIVTSTEGTVTGSGDAGTGSSDAGTGSSDAGTGAGTESTEPAAFTDEQQARIDKQFDKRFAKMKTEQQKTIDQLNKFKKTSDMTIEERNKLQVRITSLEESMMTKEEIAVKNRKEADKQHKNEVTTLQKELVTWKDRYSSETIDRAILDAASNNADENPAINPSQIVTILKGHTALIEQTVDGNNTGEFVPRVKFAGRDSEGKPMQMDLTVPEAITEMKKMEPEYGNLWKSGLTGGVGSNNTPGSSGIPTEASLSSQEEYMKHRQKIKETV